jgi:hypothetical protein
MRIHLQGAIAILAMMATPTFADTATPQIVSPSTQSSGAGIPGQAGGKSGPAASRDGATVVGQGNPTTRLQDSSGIQGKPGGKSGPPVTAH